MRLLWINIKPSASPLLRGCFLHICGFRPAQRARRFSTSATLPSPSLPRDNPFFGGGVCSSIIVAIPCLTGGEVAVSEAIGESLGTLPCVASSSFTIPTPEIPRSPWCPDCEPNSVMFTTTKTPHFLIFSAHGNTGERHDGR